MNTHWLSELPAALARGGLPPTDLPGTTLKAEARTTIVLVPDGALRAHEPEAPLVLKVYRYPAWSRWRTLGSSSKARREFDALAYCRELGIPAAAPIACGSQRTLLGLIRSCHLWTSYEAGTLPLRTWLRERRFEREGGWERLETWLKEIGAALRRLHAHRFFLFTASSKNVLVRDAGQGPASWLLVDMPYARFLRGRPLAALGQMRDVGVLTASVARYVGEGVLEAFYASYLPDPLGDSEAALRRRARRGARRHERKSPLRRGSQLARRWLWPRRET